MEQSICIFYANVLTQPLPVSPLITLSINANRQSNQRSHIEQIIKSRLSDKMEITRNFSKLRTQPKWPVRGGLIVFFIFSLKVIAEQFPATNHNFG